MKTSFFEIDLPQISRQELITKISSLKKGSKSNLYFLYSEFLLRANRNPFYKQVLKRADLTAIDGKGVHWSQYILSKKDPITTFYARVFLKTPILVRVIFFFILFPIQLIFNFLRGFYTIISKKDLSNYTNNELILGREFVYDIFEIALQNKWKILIVGGSSSKNTLIRNQLLKKYPKLILGFWTKSSSSSLMKDKLNSKFVNKQSKDGVVLNSSNLFEAFPDLEDAKDNIKKAKPDIVLVCLGGASGKQEFFLDNLKNDKTVKYTFATGVGAALDHLGAGAKQNKPPVWMTKSGIEWVYRFVFQPYRRSRIWDSVFTLWWWLTMQQFYQDAFFRVTSINIIYRNLLQKKKTEQEYLLVRRREILPGDVGWSFVQGGLEKDELPELAGVRETMEEVNLLNTDLEIVESAHYNGLESYPVSFLRFVLLGAKYQGSANYINIFEYSGSKKPSVNWENKDVKWFKYDKVINYLSAEKIGIWEEFKG